MTHTETAQQRENNFNHYHGEIVELRAIFKLSLYRNGIQPVQVVQDVMEIDHKERIAAIALWLDTLEGIEHKTQLAYFKAMFMVSGGNMFESM